jgi:hypothetical protein
VARTIRSLEEQNRKLERRLAKAKVIAAQIADLIVESRGGDDVYFKSQPEEPLSRAWRTARSLAR